MKINITYTEKYFCSLFELGRRCTIMIFIMIIYALYSELRHFYSLFICEGLSYI